MNLPFGLMLAVALITSPPDKLDAMKYSKDDPFLESSLDKVAIVFELITEKSKYYQGPSNPKFGYELNCRLKLHCLNNMYNEVKDCPSMDWVKNFPNSKEIRECMKFNRDYYAYLNNRKFLFPQDLDYLSNLQKECDEVWSIYNMLDNVQSGYMLYWRRKYLKELKDKLGDQLFYSGGLPPPVPVYGFSRE